MGTACPKCKADNPDSATFCADCGANLSSPRDISVTKTMEIPAQELNRGTLIAERYEIIEKLGRGGMGDVYRVTDTKIKEEVALKLLKPDISSDNRKIERFKNELKLARKIRHKNVCQMFDIGEADGTHFITMEYFPGENLKSFIHRAGRIDIPKAVAIAKQVCEGLSEAHRLGVVHRDLKSSNVMIDKEGNTHIMDFGLAQSLESKGLTQEGIAVGTPEYMSPEQAEGKDVDQRSDLYSLGMILYEMVTGQLPFKGTPLNIARKQVDETPRNPKELHPQISDNLNDLILKCLEKDKEIRCQSASEVHSILENIEKDLGASDKEIHKKALISKVISGKHGLRKLIVLTLAVIAIMIITLIIWQTMLKKETSSIPPEKSSVAVLPFEDLSPQKDQGHLCDGIAESIINALSNIRNLYVPAPTLSFSFKEKNLKIQKIGETLKVKTVLRGSLQKAGNKIRITAQLINVEDESLIWSGQFPGEIDDIFDVQDMISLAVVDKLKVKLLEEETGLVKRHTENLEAYNLYLKGRYFWNRRYEGGLQKGIECFQQAIDIDPKYSLAYVGIADCYNLLGVYSLINPKEAYTRSKEAIQKALDIDDSLAEAHASLGWIKMFFDWDWHAAEEEIKLALELNPNYASAHEYYGIYFTIMGQLDNAIAEMRKAQELDPLELIINAMVGWAFHFARQHDKAIEQFNHTNEMEPDFSIIYFFRGLAYAEKAMWENAISDTEKLVALTSESPFALGALGNVLSRSGKYDEALKILNRLNELSKERYVSSFYKAIIYMEIGKKDEAFIYLEKAYKERDSMLALLKNYPMFDSLRSDPRFAELMKKVGIK